MEKYFLEKAGYGVAFAADGILAQTELTFGRNFSPVYDESSSYIGRATTTVSVRGPDPESIYPVQYVNRSAEDIPIGSSDCAWSVPRSRQSLRRGRR